MKTKIIWTDQIEIWGDSVIVVYMTTKGLIIKYYEDLGKYHEERTTGFVEYKHTEEFM